MPTKPHSVVKLWEGDDATVAVVCEDGSAYYFDFKNMDWISMGIVPGTEAEQEYLPGNSPK